MEFSSSRVVGVGNDAHSTQFSNSILDTAAGPPPQPRCLPLCRHDVAVASDGFAVDYARPPTQTGECLHDQREAAYEVIAGPAVESKPPAVLRGDKVDSIVLDFVNPRGAGGQRVGFGGKAGRNEAGREGRQTQCGRET